MTENVNEGDTITYRPKNGGKFPTGETTRNATVEAVRNDEIIVRQPDGFTDRISPDQLIDN